MAHTSRIVLWWRYFSYIQEEFGTLVPGDIPIRKTSIGECRSGNWAYSHFHVQSYV